MGGERKPPPPPRNCERCGAWVTTTGQTSGVLCGDGKCPFPKLNWGGLTLLRLETPRTQEDQRCGRS